MKFCIIRTFCQNFVLFDTGTCVTPQGYADEGSKIPNFIFVEFNFILKMPTSEKSFTLVMHKVTNFHPQNEHFKDICNMHHFQNIINAVLHDIYCLGGVKSNVTYNSASK